MHPEKYYFETNRVSGVPSPVAPISAVKVLIEELKKMDLTSTDVDVLKEQLGLLMRGHQIAVWYMDSEHKFYRGRVVDAPPKHVNDIGPPPSHLLFKYGRLNRPRQPVLYANRSVNGVFKEIHAKPGQLVAVASYKVKRRVIAFPVGFSDEALTIKGWHKKVTDRVQIDKDSFNYEFNRIVSDFFADQFLKDVSVTQDFLYKLSVAWSEMLFSIDAADAIVYPSVANAGASVNTAFKADSYKDVLDLERIDVVRLDSQTEDMVGLTFLKRTKRIAEDGSLKFYHANPIVIPDQARLSSIGDFCLVDGKWVITDLSGTQIGWETDSWRGWIYAKIFG